MTSPQSAFEAPTSWHAIECLSDLHLCADSPRTFETLARHLARSDADAIVIMGDLFEAWVGDDARFDDFEQRCVAALQESSRRRFTAFICGNRDFLVGPELLDACGVHSWSDPQILSAFGTRYLLTHGDALCLGEADYQRFRAQVRSPGWQSAFLSQPLDVRRAQARQMRDASQARHDALTSWHDIDIPTAIAWLQENNAPCMIHGHTHHPSFDILAPGYQRWVLSDWDMDSTHARADILRISPDGINRISPISD